MIRAPYLSRLTRLFATAALAAIALSGCGTVAKRAPAPVVRAPEGAPPKPVAPRPGGYYLDDGPGDNPPANLDAIPDAVPRREPLHRGAMRPYSVMGQDYTPMTQIVPYKARGVATWYGRRYHGLPTSSGEIYDMYQMTAAHTILPIPSYARVTNVATNKSVVVRINDRGPFRADRLIDLSYTAAYKLGVLGGGRTLVEVETIVVDGEAPIAPALAAAPAAAREPVVTAPVVTVAAGDQGTFLQLGAFGSQANADSYLARLRAQLAWLAPVLHVFARDGWFRVHAGPYANPAEARAAADRISDSLGLKVLVLPSR